MFGGFYLLSMAFFPGLFASLAAINVERKERQPILALYMFNNVSVMKKSVCYMGLGLLHPLKVSNYKFKQIVKTIQYSSL